MAQPDRIAAPDSPGRQRQQQQQRSRRRRLPLLPRRRCRRPRSSGVPAAAATAAIAFVALAAAPPGASHSHRYHLAHAAQPLSIRKKPEGATRHNHPPEATSIRGRGGAGNVMADAAMAAEGVFFRSSSSGNRDRAVIVQPDSLPRRQEEDTAPHGHIFTQSYGGDDQEAASKGWQPRRRQAQEEPSWEEELSQSRGRPPDFAGQRPPYGLAANSNVEYYRDGKAMQQVSSSYENTDDNITFEEFMDAQQLRERGGGEGQGTMKSSSMHVADYNYGASDGGGGGRYEDYEEWLANRGYGQTQARKQRQARARGAPMSPPESRSKQKMPDRGSAMNPPKPKSTPLEDLDPVSGKQVILRPRLNNDALPDYKPMGLPPMGSSSSGGSASQSNSGGGDGKAPKGREQPVVYYYDPQALQSSLPDHYGGEMGVPELALPEVVYDSSGRALRLEQVHAGGRNEVFLEVKPRAVWGTSDFPSSWDDTLGSLRSRFVFDLPSSPNGARQSQDQLIVIFTVATMAVMVGALSAKRLRSRRMLESCMHPELEDDDWAADEFGSTVGSVAATPRYDKKFDGSAAVGTSASEGGRRSGSSIGAYYSDNESGVGGLHWRGDMEKFDV